MFSILRERSNRKGSPSRLSEISLKKYSKKIRSRENLDDVTLDKCHLNSARSTSMNILSDISADQRSAAPAEIQFPVFSRAVRLETLEAKMASIESSLSVGTGSSGCRQRTRGAAETTEEGADSLSRPSCQQQQQQKSEQSYCAEVDLLRATIEEKDQLISGLSAQLNLHTMLRGEQYKQTLHGYCSLKDRLRTLEEAISTKATLIKNLKVSLQDKFDDVDVDLCISRAQLEYEVELEELDMLTLQSEQMNLQTSIAELENKRASVQSLSSSVMITDELLLRLVTIKYVPSQPAFSLQDARTPGGGTIVSAVHASECALRENDRVVELNTRNVIHTACADVLKYLNSLPCDGATITLLVVRIENREQTQNLARDLHTTRREVKLLRERLEYKVKENKHLHGEKEKVGREAKSCRLENSRLHHRISYLNEHVKDLQNDLDKIRGVTDESFRRIKKDVTSNNFCGAESADKRHLPKLNESERLVSVENDDTKHALSTNHLKSAFNSVRRPNKAPSDTCSLSGLLDRFHTSRVPSRHGGGGRFPTDCASEINFSVGKSKPPRKPARLSVCRSSSTQNINEDGSMDCLSETKSSAHRKSSHPFIMYTWPQSEKSSRSHSKLTFHRSRFCQNIANLPKLIRRNGETDQCVRETKLGFV